MQKDIFKRANEIKEYISEIRNNIHQNPELGMKETKTSELIKQELIKYGVEIVDINVKTGVVGILKGKKQGKDTVTAIRADMDALPIIEKTGLLYASQVEGVMHACGHDGHTAILLGVAKLLSSIRDEFSGTVKFIFQPAEELASGAQAMIDAGALENPKVDNIIALHSWPYMPAGVIGTWKGAYYAASDKFEAKMIGGSGHGAYPHKTPDSLLAASHAVVALQAIPSRQLNAIDNTVLSVCFFNAGSAFNVIPEFSKFGGTVRTHNDAVRKSMPEKMEKIISGIAQTFGCEYEFNYKFGLSMVYNDGEVVDKVTEAVKQSLGEEYVKVLPGPVMGGEDFGEYSRLVKKSAIFRLGTRGNDGVEIPLHSEKYNFNNDAIPYGITALVQYVLNENI